MFVGSLRIDVSFDAHSLKEKRGIIRPVLADLSHRFGVHAAEVDLADLHRRAVLGVACCSGSAAHVTELLDRAERQVVARPELIIGSVHRRLFSDDD